MVVDVVVGLCCNTESVGSLQQNSQKLLGLAMSLSWFFLYRF